MSSIKWRLAVALGLVELFTLAMALVLYVAAQRQEESSHSTSRANDEVRDLLSFALLARRYMNAFVANRVYREPVRPDPYFDPSLVSEVASGK
jgi:hypothetical protein